MEKNEKHQKLLSLSNKYYTLIPHDFGDKETPLVDNMQVLENKLKIMETLIDIEIATDLLKKGDKTEESIIDSNYLKLKTNITPLEKDDKEFEMCETYAYNQMGHFRMTLADVFKIEREGEKERYSENINLGNSNFYGMGLE